MDMEPPSLVSVQSLESSSNYFFSCPNFRLNPSHLILTYTRHSISYYDYLDSHLSVIIY